MKQKTLAAGLFVAALLMGAGCGSTSSGGGKSPTKVIGVNASGNEKELVALVPALKQCEFSETFGISGGYNECPAYKDIKEKSPDLPNGLATLVNFFEDSEPIVRYAAAHALSTSFYSSNPAFADEASANRVWEAINKESFLVTQKAMTGALGNYAVKVPSAVGKVVILIKGKAYKPALRAEYLNFYQPTELIKDPSVYAAIVAVAEDESEDADVRKSAITQFMRAPSDMKAQIKPIVEKLAKSPNAAVAEKATKALEQLNK